MSGRGMQPDWSRETASPPYIGARPLQRADSGVFFGRDRETREIISLWRAHRIVVLHGNAGVGKTSVLQAGVLPVLGNHALAKVLPVGRLTPPPAARGLRPRGGNPYRRALLANWSGASPPPPDESVGEFLSQRLPCDIEQEGHLGIFAAIDQFEEILADLPGSNDLLEQLIEEFAVALRHHDSLRLLLVLRSDYLPALLDYQNRLSEYRFAPFCLDGLDSQAALDAVRAPLSGTARSFGVGVAEHMVEMLRTFRYTDSRDRTVTVRANWISPLELQVSCAHLWSSLPDKVNVITMEHLKSAEPEQAMADFYDIAIRDVCQWTRHAGIDERELRDWLEFNFITELGTRGTAIRGLSATANMPNRIADAFADLHILVLEHREQATWYELAEDRLVSAIRRSNKAWREAHGAEEPRSTTARSAAVFRSAADEAIGAGDLLAAHRLLAIAADSYRSADEMWDAAATLELQGEAARSRGDLVLAEQCYSDALFEFTVLEDASAQVRLLSTIGDVYRDLNDYVKAVQFHQLASERLPTDVDALIGLGYAQWNWGSPADADATFTKALGWNRNKGQALAGRGQVRVELREYPDALADLDRALTLSLPLDSEIDARSARAVALADLGREAEAAHELRTAQLQDPDRPRTRIRAARVAVATGRADIAFDELSAALHADIPLPPTEEDSARELLAELASNR
jgi:tetratricopeptide (TPR) repeat protein